MAGKGITTGGSYGSQVGDAEAGVIDLVQRRKEVPQPGIDLPVQPIDSPLAQSLAAQGYDISDQSQPAPSAELDKALNDHKTLSAYMEGDQSPEAQQWAGIEQSVNPGDHLHDIGKEIESLQSQRPSTNVDEQRAREYVAPISQRAVLLQNDPAQAALDRAVNVTKIFDEEAAGPTIPVKLKSKSAFTAGDTDTAYRGELSADRLFFDPEYFAAGEINAEGKSRVNPMFGAVAGMVTENFFRNSGVQDGQTFFGNEFEEAGPDGRVLETPKAKDNQKLGRQIWEEWQRERAALGQFDPADPTKVPTLEGGTPPPAQALAAMGGLAKEAYAAANPAMVTPVRGVGEGEQTTYTVSPEGIKQMDKAYAALNKPFESHEIPPLNAPSPTAQPEHQASTRAKSQTTATGIKKAGPRIAQAKRNYHNMKRVLNSGREKIFYAQLAPALLAAFEGVSPAVIQDADGRPSFDPEILKQAPQNLYADAYKVGTDRAAALVQQKKNQIIEIETDIQQAEADLQENQSEFNEIKLSKLRDQLKKAKQFSPALVYKQDVLKALESMNTAARYSNQVFHNTFSTQMLTGRLGIQQNKLNPQNNTMLRFVAGSPNVVRINPQSSDKVANNFRETMAVHFLNGGSDLKPHKRVEAFSAWRNGRQFNVGNREFNGKVSWDDAVAAGQEIKQWTNNVDSAGMREALGQLQVDVSLPLGEILGPLTGIAAQPELSAKTLNTIERIAGKKKSEVPYITDWLGAIADFDNNQPFSTPIEVEVDGITHGISSNAMALGIETMALRSGVISPHPDLKLTSTDESVVAGDLRDAMKDTMYNEAENMAQTLISQADQTSVDALVQLAHQAIQDRDNYLKKSPMTLGYGQEINSLKQHVRTTINTGDRFKEINEIIESSDNNVTRTEATDYLHGLLVESIMRNMDPRVLQTASMLRANNLLSVLTDRPLFFDNGSGFRSNIASVTDVPGSAESTTFSIKEGDERTTVRTPIYTEKYAAGSAPRVYQEGDAPIPGGYGHGRSIPTMAQTYDATMLSGVASGRTNDNMKRMVEQRGYEYSWLPVFDAAKVDMSQLDLVRDAMNREWIDGIKDNDYVGQIMGPSGWFDQTMKDFIEEMNALPQGVPIEISGDSKWRGVSYLLNDYFGGLNYVRAAIGVDNQLGDSKDPDLPKEILKRINADIRSTGIKIPFKDQAPVTELRPDQMVAVVQAWMHHLQVRNRNAKLASEVKADRASLFKKINNEDVLQVDL